MKLQCKICGSFNLTNKDNQIVCDDCGCKYPIEEAKNLLQNDETTTTSYKSTQIPYTEQEKNPNIIIKNTEKKNDVLIAGIIITCMIAILAIAIILYPKLNSENKPSQTNSNPTDSQTTAPIITEPPQPKIIVLNDENISQYCNIYYNVTPDSYKESLLVNGYQNIITQVTVEGKTAKYKFKNVELEVTVTIEAAITTHNLFSKETNTKKIREDCYVILNEQGNKSKSIKHLLNDDDVIEKKNPLRSSYTYTVKSGYLELIE